MSEQRKLRSFKRLKGITVLSLFDGMSCGQIALNRVGINIENYYASEIDKYAMQVTQHNYPNTIQIDSVLDITMERLSDFEVLLNGKYIIDTSKVMLIGGSPCQGFSLAGKMKGSSTKCGKDVTTLEQYLQLKEDGFEFDGQSYLFWEYVRVWKAIQPKYFFLENVRVTKQWLPMFNDAMGVEPIMINSALVSAQNRVRYYWTNIPDVTQPDDKDILLKDILERGVSTEEMTTKGKSFCLTARYSGAVAWNSIEKKQRSMVLRPCELKEFNENNTCHHVADATDIKGNESIKRVYGGGGKAPTLTTSQGGHREPKVLLEASDNIINVKKGSSGKSWFMEQQTYSEDSPKTRTLKAGGGSGNIPKVLCGNPTYRKLTPLECERLQTVEDNYTDVVSNSQRYKMLGNGWTIDVVAHMFKVLVR